MTVSLEAELGLSLDLKEVDRFQRDGGCRKNRTCDQSDVEGMG